MISDTLRTFILSDVWLDGSPDDLGNDTPLLERGILDSLGILNLVSFIEDEWGVTVEDEELDPRAFRHDLADHPADRNEGAGSSLRRPNVDRAVRGPNGDPLPAIDGGVESACRQRCPRDDADQCRGPRANGWGGRGVVGAPNTEDRDRSRGPIGGRPRR